MCVCVCVCVCVCICMWICAKLKRVPGDDSEEETIALVVKYTKRKTGTTT